MSDAPGEKSSDVRGWCVHVGEKVCQCVLQHLLAGVSIAGGSACAT